MFVLPTDECNKLPLINMSALDAISIQYPNITVKNSKMCEIGYSPDQDLLNKSIFGFLTSDKNCSVLEDKIIYFIWMNQSVYQIYQLL